MPFELQLRVLGFLPEGFHTSSAACMALAHSSWTDAALEELYRHIVFNVSAPYPDELDEYASIHSHPWISRVRQLAWTMSQKQSPAPRVRILDITFKDGYMRVKEFEDAITDLATCLRHMQHLQYLYVRTLDKRGILFGELTYFLAHNATKLRGLHLARPVTDVAVECGILDPLFDAICDLGKRTDERLVLVVFPEVLSEIDFSHFAEVPLSVVECDDEWDDFNTTLWLDLSAYAALDSNTDALLEAYLQDVRREFTRGAERTWSRYLSQRNAGLLPYQLRCLHLYITTEEIRRGVLRRTFDTIASSPRLDDLKTFCLRFPESQDPLPTAALLAALAPPIRVPCHIRIVQEDDDDDAPPVPLDVDPEQLVVSLGKTCPSLRVVSLSSVVWTLQDMESNRWERLALADAKMLMPVLL
ncbi:hypothetical protein EXIGLDRAFT_831269 [Exidia glandulosa HHB12029]|uniref:Uncharacterized protein n=1 Tax=Exidia glandulosa HHB12029 TaxID=1314781 RepID=A0A165MTB9_EXIGL|nr:hypothetical protein EXIGLDRAFT_831269 [Exidia glandulosa HHB12029]